MPLPKENKRLLQPGEFFLGRTWRYLLKSLWLFFPSILFLLLAYFIFWHITQGKDLMVITLEDPKGRSTFVEFLCFVIALVFWVYVTWYSTRLVARAKQFQEPDDDPTWEIFRVQAPRVLAFSCITIILLAFLQLKNYGYPHLSSKECHLILLFSYAWYFLLYQLWSLYVQQGNRTKQEWIRFLKNTRSAAFWALIWFGIVMMRFKSFGSVIAMLVALQIGLVLLLIVRRDLDEATSEGEPKGLNDITPRSRLWKRIKFNILNDEKGRYVKAFMLISLVGVGFYLASIIFIRFAVFIGPFPFMLLAFGVLLGFGNMLAYLSVLVRFNFHLLAFVLSLIFGFWFDSHKLQLPSKEKDKPLFSQRQNLKDYFVYWLKNDPDRKRILEDSTAPKYPVYFVMANGGASRSGYWTAKILGGLEDTSGGNFSRHLFCLSGASGGSVGNATFFSLLRAKENLKAKNLSYSQAAGEYLKSDFLSFTLSHFLGPDIFRNLFPLFNLLEMDRGRALAMSLEKAPLKSCFLYDSFHVRFSSFITQKKDSNYLLPIICINATRMRDGAPAVFSNIRIDSDKDSIQYNYFNDRVDILSQLGESRDIKLSTAVVLGASFPYISPAGRIDYPKLERNEKGKLEKKKYTQYFVDGGYFDNSGAGVVNEMIFALNNIMDNDDSLKKYKNRLEFFVLHILNTDPKKIGEDPLNSITNDLMAPAKTMIGSWGKQTTVNDQRLKSYLYSLYKDTVHYKKVDLYDDPLSDFRFSMNWVFSDKQLTKMNEALSNNKAYQKEKKKMGGWRF